MEANMLNQVTDGLQPDWLTDEECLLLEEWYRHCESNPGLLQQMSRTELQAMQQQQFQFITERLGPQKKLVLFLV